MDRCLRFQLPERHGSFSTVILWFPRQARTLRSSLNSRVRRSKSTHSLARHHVTFSHRWLPTLRTGSHPWRCWHFQATPSPRAWGVSRLERRSTTSSTRTIPRRPSRSSGLWAPRSSWSACPLMPLPALVRTRQASIRSTNRSPRTTPVLHMTTPAKPLRRADGSPGPSRASQVSRAPGQTGQTSSTLLMVCTSALMARPLSLPVSKNAMSIRRALSDLPRPCWPRPSLQVVSPRP